VGRDTVVSDVSAYVKRLGRPYQEKEEFWFSMMQLLSAVNVVECIFVGGDLNGHADKCWVGWFRYVVRTADDDWVKKCTKVEIVGKVGKGRGRRHDCSMLMETRKI